ncbi:uncharacterized protein ASCRUDRAFT_77380 [Ascoidea rubescens DSM 1968]|uniref:Uncharacterized protein n=1 Tax=Ascoidea rubescens DSM 1968 TaxID=1344418 RepID=A0A1D2VBT7_9ASCO|nr:hypothetical protein ASCRUDRAFT_77380 [Ascoidea rubescens DSM 1968]ODV58943.1 hypothetical protein ASCRUDRAFT_77380 [Ascoidea rubescens DSM 1968]
MARWRFNKCYQPPSFHLIENRPDKHISSERRESIYSFMDVSPLEKPLKIQVFSGRQNDFHLHRIINR